MTNQSRIQLKRTSGWRMPPNAVKVTRPGPWGNPYKVGVDSEFGIPPDVETAVMFFRAYAAERIVQEPDWLDDLIGKDLACWCKAGEICHADVLIEMVKRIKK